MEKSKSYSNKIADSKLTAGIRNGDTQSFRGLFDRYHAKIYNVSRSLGISQEDSEGVVQEVFLTIWEKRAHLDDTLSINAFMLTIAKRLVYKKIRSKVTRLAHETAEQQAKKSWHNDTEEYIIFSELDQLAKDGIEKLPEGRKQIFMLSREHGLTNDEIARELSISKRTVENQLYRATTALRKHIDTSQSS